MCVNTPLQRAKTAKLKIRPAYLLKHLSSNRQGPVVLWSHASSIDREVGGSNLATDGFFHHVFITIFPQFMVYVRL